MIGFVSSSPATRAIALGLLAWLAAAPANGQSVPPVPVPGPWPVACSNVEQDFSRVPAGETAEMYWRGLASGGVERYVTSLLVAPQDALVATFTAPHDPALYSRWSGQALTYLSLVCYPTDPANTRADYALPNGKRIPRMQRGGEPPIFPEGDARFPVLVYSHGYAGSPLSGTYLDALLAFASHGYVTVAPFHGDLRYSVSGPDNGGSRSVYVPIWDEFVAMQATRSLSGSAALGRIASDADWTSRIDLGRVGGFGISQGGETLMLMGGAALTYTLELASKPVATDPRLKAAVGYVPYFGLEDLPAFGAGQQGAALAKVPYLALSGTKDPIAPLPVVEQAFAVMGVSRGLVALEGEGHELSPSSAGDVYTWALTFLAAYVQDDANARATLASMQSVSGGLDDRKLQYVDVGGSVDSSVRATIEFHHAGFDHYFITAEEAEATALDQGSPPGWKRTGFAFKSWRPGEGSGADACRFFGTPGIGPNSHFYTVDAAECATVKANPIWTYEGLAFRAVPFGEGCTPGLATVTRLYNNGMGGEANHRYLTDPAETQRMTGLGWLVEGPVFCIPP